MAHDGDVAPCEAQGIRKNFWHISAGPKEKPPSGKHQGAQLKGAVTGVGRQINYYGVQALAST